MFFKKHLTIYSLSPPLKMFPFLRMKEILLLPDRIEEELT